MTTNNEALLQLDPSTAENDNWMPYYGMAMDIISLTKSKSEDSDKKLIVKGSRDAASQ